MFITFITRYHSERTNLSALYCRITQDNVINEFRLPIHVPARWKTNSEIKKYTSKITAKLNEIYFNPTPALINHN